MSLTEKRLSQLPERMMMAETNRVLLSAGLGCLLIFAIGCRSGDGPERITMTGKVSFQGKPIEEGQIRFVPLAGTKAPVAIGEIKNGVYHMAGDQGVPVGTHRIEILAFNPNDPIPKGPGGPPRKQLIPDQYNKQSSLHATLESGQKSKVENFDLM